ncbi:MAG: amidase [Anaerolineae bacterium]|jgi:amidase
MHESPDDGYDSIGREAFEATIAPLQAAQASGASSARQLTAACLARVAALDRAGPGLRAVLEVNPDALSIAEALDDERASGAVRGPLHGIPILVKDNIDTADSMLTTAGSLALANSRPAQDATVVARLRQAGAVILGKANLSEWANFRSPRSSSGWSGRGGQTRNPYVLDRSPSGSSSGSAVAVAASLCVVALGTETDGSVIAPSAACGIVGLKPTVGLTSRAGVIPIAPTQDTVGVHARCVADAALVLGALVGADHRDGATQASAGRFDVDYTRFLDRDGLAGARLGVLRDRGMVGYNQHVDAAYARHLEQLQRMGAELVDPVSLAAEQPEGDDEWTVLLVEFRAALAAYLATRRPGPSGRAPLRTLAEVIAFNEAHSADEMPYFGQETLVESERSVGVDDPAYLAALARSRDAMRVRIDALLADHRLDALIAPSGPPACVVDLLNGDRGGGGCTSPAARAGYPLLTVPAGEVHGLPLGLTFMGTAFSEPALIRLAYGFEQHTCARRPPRYLPTLRLP